MQLLYFEALNPCCDGDAKSQQQLLEERATVARLWLVEEITGKEWGDDWNDAPKCCNAGPPYAETCKGLVIVELKMGEPVRLEP